MDPLDQRNPERRLGTELQQSHSLLRWVAGIVAAELAVMVFGGVTIWVNDRKQDETLVRHGVEISQAQTKREADLMRELLEAKIGGNTKAADEIKAILVRMEQAIKDLSK